MGQHLHPFMPSQPVVGYRCTQPKQQRAVSWAWVVVQHSAADSVMRVAILWHTQEPEQSPGLQHLMNGRLTHPPNTPASCCSPPSASDSCSTRTTTVHSQLHWARGWGHLAWMMAATRWPRTLQCMWAASSEHQHTRSAGAALRKSAESSEVIWHVKYETAVTNV
jgi:hypothetical protein